MVTIDRIDPIDRFVITSYLLALLAVTAWIGRRHVGASETSADYFLGGKGIPWWAVGCSLFVSNIGTDHLVGLAGSGAQGGLAVGMYEWNAPLVLMLLGFIFVPHYMAANVYTVPEYLEQRYGRSMRDFFTWLSIAATFFSKITVTTFAGAIVLRQVAGWDTMTSSLALLVLTGAYTAVGGLAAVMYAEVLQALVMMVGCCALLLVGLQRVGGWAGLEQKLPPSYFEILRPNSDPEFPWFGVLFGMPINGIWYWCCDQTMVQRTLAANCPAEAQRGCVLASWAKILPMYLMVLPGLIAAALFPAAIADNSNSAFPILVVEVMPVGLKGLIICGMLCSFMGALASCFNSISTLFTMDIYRPARPAASEEELVLVGRTFTLVIAGASLLWVPMIARVNGQLFLYIQSMQNIWCAPIVVVFLASMMCRSMSSDTAWTTLWSGLALGIGFWSLQNIFTPELLAPYPLLLRLHKMNVLLFSPLAFLFSSAVALSCHWTKSSTNSASDIMTLDGGREASESSLLMPAVEEVHDATDEHDYENYKKQQWAGLPTVASGGLSCAVVVALVCYYQAEFVSLSQAAHAKR
eukprot:TRINITY_DN6856_c0_g1_i4.p1 TRINITY_DN6856_c0_g1~~TRINITY_DN6856_c0_g1_i4.p1  ORF type:complete len:580 (-),score=104.72 TRINITY_DN6856_c0_g1_i4:103-1842(-)